MQCPRKEFGKIIADLLPTRLSFHRKGQRTRTKFNEYLDKAVKDSIQQFSDLSNITPDCGLNGWIHGLQQNQNSNDTGYMTFKEQWEPPPAKNGHAMEREASSTHSLCHEFQPQTYPFLFDSQVDEFFQNVRHFHFLWVISRIPKEPVKQTIIWKKNKFQNQLRLATENTTQNQPCKIWQPGCHVFQTQMLQFVVRFHKSCNALLQKLKKPKNDTREKVKFFKNHLNERYIRQRIYLTCWYEGFPSIQI